MEKIIEVEAKTGSKQRTVIEKSEKNLVVKTTFPPEKGKANRDIIKLVAEYYSVPKSNVEIINGHTYHRKKLKID